MFQLNDSITVHKFLIDQNSLIISRHYQSIAFLVKFNVKYEGMRLKPEESLSTKIRRKNIAARFICWHYLLSSVKMPT